MWTLGKLFGRWREHVEDLEFIDGAAKYFTEDQIRDQPGLSFPREDVIGFALQGNEWPGHFRWPAFTAGGDPGEITQPVEWEISVVVTTAFVGKGPLKGYNEIREIKGVSVLRLVSADPREFDHSPRTKRA